MVKGTKRCNASDYLRRIRLRVFQEKVRAEWRYWLNQKDVKIWRNAHDTHLSHQLHKSAPRMSFHYRAEGTVRYPHSAL